MEEDTKISQPEELREMTYGEKAVGLDFNPAQDANVQKVKELYAQIINLCYNLREGEKTEKARLLSVAITQAQQAQMWAVKGITYKY